MCKRDGEISEKRKAGRCQIIIRSASIVFFPVVQIKRNNVGKKKKKSDGTKDARQKRRVKLCKLTFSVDLRTEREREERRASSKLPRQK